MSDTKTRGFFLGKFMPPHMGHVMVARAGAALVDEMTVLVCSLPDDTLPGALRYEWMQALCPGASVLHHDTNIPQEPDDHPDFWNIWRDAIKGLHPEPITHVFGSDAYINQLAEELGAKPVILDPDREACPVSSSDIRQAPFKHWKHIPELVRPHFAKRVCVYGPESTGKTTLAKSLAAIFETSYMPEYGRIFDEQVRPEVWTPQHFVEIAVTHEAMREAMMPTVNRILIEDTDPVLTKVWSHAYIQEADPWFDQEIALADLYLVTDVDVPWVNDGLRKLGQEEERRAFFDAAVKELETRGANYLILSGSWAQRQAKAEDAVLGLLTKEERGA